MLSWQIDSDQLYRKTKRSSYWLDLFFAQLHSYTTNYATSNTNLIFIFPYPASHQE